MYRGQVLVILRPVKEVKTGTIQLRTVAG